MPASRPVATTVAWKRRAERPEQYHTATVALLDYVGDSNAGLAGIQQQALIDNIPHDPADEIIDVFTVDVGPNGQQLRPRLIKMPFSVTLQNVGGIDSVATSLTVSALAKAADWPDNAFIRIDDEYMQITAGGGTTSWTVTRAIHGSEAAAHSQNVEIYRVVFNVSHKEITLSGDTETVSAPTLVLTPVFDGFELRITPPGDAGRKLEGYYIYRDTASPATTFYSQVRGDDDSVRQVDIVLNEGEDKSATYYFRAKSVTKSGNKSDFSNEVSGQVLTVGHETPAVKPDPPTVTVVTDGGDVMAGFGFLVGIEFSSDVGAGGVTETQLQIAEPGVSHSVSTGFTTAIVDDLGNRPPVKFRPRVGKASSQVGGAYQFSARIFNFYASGGSGAWSDWSAPVTSVTGGGNADSGVPGAPRAFWVVDTAGTDGELGNSITAYVQEPPEDTGNPHSIYAYEVQASVSLWGTTLAEALRLTQVDVNGTCDITHGTKTVSSVSPALTASAHVGDILYLYETADTATGQVLNNFASVITANDTTSITIQKPVPFATQSGYNFAIGPDWDGYDFRRSYQFIGRLASGGITRITGAPDLEIFEIGPISFSVPAYWRIRAFNAFGWGQWMYYDVIAGGTTTRLDANQFTPGLLLAPAVGANALTAAVQALDAQPMGHDLTWTPDGASPHRRFTWGAGTIYFADGSTQSINAGDTGLLTASTKYWLYATIGSATLTITATASNAFGTNKIIIAVVKTGGVAADGISIIGRWAPGSTISAKDVIASTLSAITADVGELTAGTITALLIRTAAGSARIELDSTNGFRAVGGKVH